MRTVALALCLLVGFAGSLRARPALDPVPIRAGEILRGAPAERFVGAEVDSVFLLGGPGRVGGRFEDADGNAAWNGWTSVDNTRPDSSHWQIDERLPVSGQRSLWCGSYYDNACGFGYGNDWEDRVVFRHAVADTSVAVTVNLQAQLVSDTEPGFDYVNVQYNHGGSWWQLMPGLDGIHEETIDVTVVIEPAALVDGEVQLRFDVISDGAWSDEDCLWDTEGALRLDHVQVTVDGEVVDFEDFEDGTSDRWQPQLDPGVGDFAKIWIGLQDLDPCRFNLSPQVAFIDDGLVVPGTGGTSCITWCYGPGGFIVNHSGGLMGPGYKLDNGIVSPPLPWPADCDGGELRYTVYRHETLWPMSPQIFDVWHVRSTASEDPADLVGAPWRDRNYVYYGGPEYQRSHRRFDDLLVPGARWVQVELAAFQYYNWGHGDDGTPAPYFDDVAVLAWPGTTAQMTAAASDLARDGFPAAGALDPGDPAGWCVRFDAAQDEVRFDVMPRPGAVLVEAPRLHFQMQANPLFDTYRVLPPDAVQIGAVITGSVAAFEDPQGHWRADLPDTAFFYPGDVIHYRFEAIDELAGDVRTSVLPADTSGFVVRALPSVTSLDPLTHANVLLWQDDSDGDEHWQMALANLGVTVDRFHDGHLGTPATLAGYRVLLYDGGDLGDGGWEGPIWDAAPLLMGWLDLGERDLVLCGDNVASDVPDQFLIDYAGIEDVEFDVRPWIDGQTSPQVLTMDAGAVFPSIDRWVALGSCPNLSTLDYVMPGPDTWTLAQFAAADGTPGGYLCAAATLYVDPVTASRTLLVPYGLSHILGAPAWQPAPADRGLSARALWLRDVLAYLGVAAGGTPTAIPDAAILTLAAAPNPFNPQVTLSLTVPQADRVRCDIYDLRGARVRTLLDVERPAGPLTLSWDGADDGGRSLGSGVYFARVTAGGDERVKKLVLVR